MPLFEIGLVSKNVKFCVLYTTWGDVVLATVDDLNPNFTHGNYCIGYVHDVDVCDTEIQGIKGNNKEILICKMTRMIRSKWLLL